MGISPPLPPPAGVSPTLPHGDRAWSPRGTSSSSAGSRGRPETIVPKCPHCKGCVRLSPPPLAGPCTGLSGVLPKSKRALSTASTPPEEAP